MRPSSVLLRRVAHLVVMTMVVAACLAPQRASAGFLDFLLGGNNHPAQKTKSLTDPAGSSSARSAARADAGHSTGYCVRSCDGRYFPVQARGNASLAQTCQAFCPAASTRVYFGGNIDSAVSETGGRYADSNNAFLYRKTLKPGCTCNGRDPAGLAPIDLSFDTTLRRGDVVATSDGLVAYTRGKTDSQTTDDFTPVADYPGLTTEVRAKLGTMKVAPLDPDITDESADASTDDEPVAPSTIILTKSPALKAKRADLD